MRSGNFKGVIRSGKRLNMICFLANEFDRKKLTLQYTDAVKLFSYIHLPMYIIRLAVPHSGIN